MPVRNETQRHEEVGPQAGANTTVLLIAGRAQPGRHLFAALERRGHATAMASSATEGVTLLRDGADLVVLVLPLPDADGREVIARIRAIDQGVSLMVAGTDSEIAGASDAFELGAKEYIGLPVTDTADFLRSVGVLLGSRRGDEHLRYLLAREAPAGWSSVVGRSPAIERVVSVFKQLSSRTQVGNTPTILITGETGTGKGFLAKTFHYCGVRRTQPYVEVNCAAIPAPLIESELFGHERGSFTDARSSRSGLFETADRGTLFLDEIGTLPLDLQAKLLNAIEEKKVRRVGGRQSSWVDVQIMTATHDDLSRRVKNGTFREDLFHRLNVVALTMPPLRERGDDVVLLAEAFLASLCREYGQPVRQLSNEAQAWMKAYTWPGNVRELRNQIERIVLLENDAVVRPEHFRSENAARLRVADAPQGRQVRITLPPDGMPLELLEQAILREALARCGWNVSRAARYLSISRQTLMYRMRKHGLAEESDE